MKRAITLWIVIERTMGGVEILLDGLFSTISMLLQRKNVVFVRILYSTDEYESNKNRCLFKKLLPLTGRRSRLLLAGAYNFLESVTKAHLGSVFRQIMDSWRGEKNTVYYRQDRDLKAIQENRRR